MPSVTMGTTHSEPCPSPGPCRPCSYRRAAGHRTPTRTAGRARSGGSARWTGRAAPGAIGIAPSRTACRNARATVLRAQTETVSKRTRLYTVPDDTALKTRSLNTLY